MQVTNKPTDTTATLTITLDEQDLKDVKRSVLNELRKSVKADGFRPGKAPDDTVIKSLGDNRVQQEVLESAINRYYPVAAGRENIQPLMQPDIKINKFVAYTELEFEASVAIVPKVTLPDFSKIKVAKEEVKVSAKDIDEVIERLRLQAATKNDVDRAAKATDQVWIDFKGVDKDGKEIEGASGEQYPLAIGSNTFIPGFEDEVLGLKKGDEKTFEITFPKDYHSEALAGAPVTFSVKVTKVQEVVLPELDEKFVSTLAPLASVDELKADIKKQLIAEKQEQNEAAYREKVVDAVVEKTKVAVPEKLVENVMHDMKHDLEQNLSYRSLTLEQYLSQQGFKDEEDFTKRELRPAAEKRAKSSLMLTEAAKELDVNVTTDELDAALEQYKKQYTDEKMQEELDKPEARQDIASRLLTTKTIEKLTQLVL